MIEFLYSSGCRAAEVAGLKVHDINLDERMAKVTGKGSKERIVYFSHKAKSALLRYWKIRGRETVQSAFSRCDKQMPEPLTTKTVWRVVMQLVKEAGLEKGSFSTHWFRHYFATKMLDETDNLALVQDLLGHSTPQSTRVYAKISTKKMLTEHRQVFP